MKMGLNLKITYETNTEKPFYMVTPTFGPHDDKTEFYPLFVGTFQEVAKFVAQCRNTSLQIDIEDSDIRIAMSQAICK